MTPTSAIVAFRRAVVAAAFAARHPTQAARTLYAATTIRDLWSAEVPLFVELWPPGLEMKRGLDAFLECAHEYFDRFIDAAKGREIRAALGSMGSASMGRLPARPIAELREFVKTVLDYPGQFTDILLLPSPAHG